MKLEELIEQIDQLDEISKKTLGKYVKKASIDVYAKGLTDDGTPMSKEHKSALKRLKGINKATNKLTKEAAEIAEHFDQLDELSKKTLGNYLRKNADQRSDLSNTKKDVQSQHKKLMDVEYGSRAALDSEDRNSLYKMRSKLQDKEKAIDKKDVKRQIGHHRAISKLTKEEAEGCTMGKKKLKKLYKESIEAMVSAVLDGNQETATQAFEAAMGAKVTREMNSMKKEIAGSIGESKEAK